MAAVLSLSSCHTVLASVSEWLNETQRQRQNHLITSFYSLGSSGSRVEDLWEPQWPRRERILGLGSLSETTVALSEPVTQFPFLLD